MQHLPPGSVLSASHDEASKWNSGQSCQIFRQCRGGRISLQEDRNKDYLINQNMNFRNLQTGSGQNLGNNQLFGNVGAGLTRDQQILVQLLNSQQQTGSG